MQPRHHQLIFPQALTESTRGPRQDQAPDGPGGYKGETEEDERRHLGRRMGINELRKKREEKQSDFRIKQVRQNALSKRGRGIRAAKARRQ